MLTKLLNKMLVDNLEKLQLIPAGAHMGGRGFFNAWSYCSDGSCSGDCVGGCLGSPRGERGNPCSDGSCSGDCVGGCLGTPAGGF